MCSHTGLGAGYWASEPTFLSYEQAMAQGSMEGLIEKQSLNLATGRAGFVQVKSLLTFATLMNALLRELHHIPLRAMQLSLSSWSNNFKFN
jgi:hypothetical protein